MADKKTIIKSIELFANLMEFKGENRFKINAFKNGALVLRRLEQDLSKMVQDGSLQQVKGIGKGLFAFVKEIVETGASEELEQILADLPDGIAPLFSIRGLGAKKIKILNEELGVSSIEELEEVCLNGSIVNIKGFTPKTSEKLISEIKNKREASKFLLLNYASKLGEQIIEQLAPIKEIVKINLTGELRRVREVISKIEISLLVSDKKEFEAKLAKLFNYKLLTDFSSHMVVDILDIASLPVLLYVTDKADNYEALLFNTTGASAFIEKIGEATYKNGYDSEKEIFKDLGENYLIPEMRELETLDAPNILAKNTNLAPEHLNGMLHFHTTFSDGSNSLLEMKNGAIDFGYNYMAVCDHSKTAFYANGLSVERLILQKEEIEKLNKSDNHFTILQGIESDILTDGSLDYEDDILKNFHFLVASVHSQFTLSEEDMTTRIIKAVENQFTNVLGHPTGRLLLSRKPYLVNMKKVIDACAENNVAIEINASPYRLDLDWRLFFYAREKGCKFAINADAHSVGEIWNANYGISIARKGGVLPEEVINCFTLDKFKNYCKK